MQPQSDLLIDRKRLKSHLMGWRALALVAILAALLLLAKTAGLLTHGGVKTHGDYIAQINIEGVMQDDDKRDDVMKDVLDDDHAKAVIVRFNSPGGTTFAGEEIYLQLKEIAKKKPVVGVMHTVCASACFMASLGTDHVVARNGTLTGSIGVLLQAVEVSQLAEKLGVKSVTIKSGAMKDVPDLAEPMTPEQRKIVSEVVFDAYDHFVAMIVDRRKMPDAQVRTLADGRVYTGAQAIKLNLIDGIGGDKEAIKWLADTHKIDPDLEVKEVKPDTGDGLLGSLRDQASLKLFGKSSMGLDGLVSIWHPSGL